METWMLLRLKEDIIMVSQGDHYRCPDPACGAELEVTKAPQEGMQGISSPICTCGTVMEKAS